MGLKEGFCPGSFKVGDIKKDGVCLLGAREVMMERDLDTYAST